MRTVLLSPSTVQRSLQTAWAVRSSVCVPRLFPGRAVSARRATTTRAEGDRGAWSTYTQFQIYRKSAALSCRLLRPQFHVTQGDGSRYTAMKKEGKLLLEFAKADTEVDGQRSYMWPEKVNFALSASELGKIIDLPLDGSVSFIHSPETGETKTLTLRPLPRAEQRGFYFNFVENRDNEKQEISIAVGDGDFTVFKELARYVIPHLLGFDVLLRQPPLIVEEHDYPGAPPKPFRPSGMESPTDINGAFFRNGGEGLSRQRPPNPAAVFHRDTPPDAQ